MKYTQNTTTVPHLHSCTQDMAVALKLPPISVGTWADDEEEEGTEGGRDEEWEEDEEQNKKASWRKTAVQSTPRGSAVMNGLRMHSPHQVCLGLGAGCLLDLTEKQKLIFFVEACVALGTVIES